MFNAKTIEESLVELSKVLRDSDELYLNKADTESVVGRLQFMLDKYLKSLDGLVLMPMTKEVERTENAMELLEGLVDIVSQQATINSKQNTALYQASMSLRREGLFNPRELYQLKEDFSAVALLHAKYKKDTERLIEESAIATQRNAELRLALDDANAALEAVL